MIGGVSITEVIKLGPVALDAAVDLIVSNEWSYCPHCSYLRPDKHFTASNNACNACRYRPDRVRVRRVFKIQAGPVKPIPPGPCGAVLIDDATPAWNVMSRP